MTDKTILSDAHKRAIGNALGGRKQSDAHKAARIASYKETCRKRQAAEREQLLGRT